MDFTLPPLDGGDAPSFRTAAEAKDWAATLPLASPALALAELRSELDRLNTVALPTAERLSTVDALGKTLLYVQEESAKRYVGKPLPLLAGEQMVLDAAVGLDRAVLLNYLRCVEQAAGDNKLLAAALERSFAALADLQLTLLRARRLLPASAWRLTGELLQTLEAQGLGKTEVSHLLRHGNPTTPLAAAGELFLMAAASPHELSLRHLGWAARWARRWGSKLELAATPPSDLAATPLCIDLAGAQAPRTNPYSGDGARFIETGALRVSIKARLAALADGRSPVELGLGDDCPAPACEALLKTLYQRWCKGVIVRDAERRPAEGAGRLILSLEAMHYHLSGGRSLRPMEVEPTLADLRRQREQMATFGTMHERPEQAKASNPANYPIEEGWQLRDESATGLRITRDAGTEGGRIALGQLVAVEPPGARQFFLAVVRWMMWLEDGRLQAGVRLLPGPVEALAARVSGSREAEKPAFLLPAFAPRKEPASVILPAGTLRQALILDVRGDQVWQIAPGPLMERGEGFERARCE
ncbi:MAG TPA: hypothetical protein VI279_00360 [Rhodocyclaceae bacterium]